MHDQFTQFLLLCPLVGFPRGYPLPIGPMMTSYRFLQKAPPPLGESSNQQHSCPDTFSCACIIHLCPGYSGLHSSFSSWRVNNSSSQNTCPPNTLYTPVHTSKVSVCEGHLTSICVHIQLLHPLTHVYSTNFEFLFKMADWTFKDALAAIQSLPSILTSVLQSMGVLHLGDIHFAKIQTTLQMWTVSIIVLEKWAEGESFNLECMAEGRYSHTTAILILLNPNAEGTALESVGVGLIVWWCMGPLGSYLHHQEAHQVCSFPDEGGMTILQSCA